MDKAENNLSREDKLALAKWLATQRGRPQYRHAPPARAAVTKIVKPLSSKFGAGVGAISQNWEQIAGPRFAKISRPVKMMGGKDGRTLVIKAPGAASALIMASSGQILSRLNTFLGHGHVARIRVMQGAMNTTRVDDPRPQPAPRGLTPSAATSLQSGLAHVRDNALRDALEALGKKALSQAPQKTPDNKD